MNLQLTIPSMACSACVDTITKAVQNIDPHAVIAADTKTKLATVETQQDETVVKEAIAAAGYPVT